MKIKKRCGKIVALLLATAMIATTICQVYISENNTSVLAETDEPTYNAANHSLKYSNDKIDMERGSYDFKTTIASNITYYVTYTVKTDGDTWFNFRGDSGRMYVGATQYAVVGVENENWIQTPGIAKAENGARITIQSSADRASVWVNGNKIVDNAILKTVDCAGQPNISWASTTATFSDIKVWIDKKDDTSTSDPDTGKVKEPQFNNETDKMWLDENFDMERETNKSFDIKFKAKDTYYLTYTLKSRGETYVDFRGNKGRMYIGPTQYSVIGIENQQWVQEAGLAKAEEGVKVTIKSSATHASVWINGKNVIDNAILVTPDQAGQFKVTWVSEAATFSNVKIWTDKSVKLDDGKVEPDVNEAKYDGGKHELKFSKDKAVLEKETGLDFETTIAPGNTYFIQYLLKTDGDFYFDFRGETGRIFISPTQYCILGVENTKWLTSNGIAKGDGVRVTVMNEGDYVTVWFNGVKVADHEKLVDEDRVGLPGVTWVTEKTTLENIKVWTAKGQDETVTVEGSDEPKYNSKKDKKYKIYKYKGGEYEDGVLKLGKEQSSFFLSDLPYNASYYMTMTVKTKSALNVQTRNRNDIFNMNATGYTGCMTDGWVAKKFPTLKHGARITVYSDAKNDKITVWVDGEKIVSGSYATAKGTAQPGIGWSFEGGLEVRDVSVWTTEIPKSDEPTYNKKTDVLHDYKFLGSVKVKNKVATVDKLASASIRTDFDSDDSYYMSMTVKTTTSVNIMYRNPDGFICISQNGYVSSGTSSPWVDRMFYKLSEGMKVTLYSTPTHIKVWADGEKLVDMLYKRVGEAYPSIAWSFDSEAVISDVKLWTKKTTESINYGKVEGTDKNPLGNDKKHVVSMQPKSTDSVAEEKVDTKKYNVAANNQIVDSKVNEVPAEKVTLPKQSLTMPVVGVTSAVIIVILGLTVFAVVSVKKKGDAN